MNSQFLLGYILAISSTVTSLLLMLVLDPLLHLTQASFLLFFGAVTITALYGGRNPGIVATVLAAIFANYFFLEPQYAWTVDLSSSIRMLLFMAQGILISILVGALRKTQEQSERSLAQLQASEAEIRRLNQELRHQVDELTLTESTLRATEQRFRRLVESNMFGVAFGDFRGGMHYANDYFLKMVGYSHEDLLAGKMRWIDMTPPEFLYLDEQAGAELRQCGVTTPFEKEYFRKDGSRVPILIGATVLQEPYEQAEEIICFYLDLTERKRVETAWQEGTQILNALMEYIPEGITIADAPNVTIRKVSRYGQQLTGRPLEPLLGTPASTHVADWGIFRADGITRPTEDELPLTRAVRQSEVVVNEEWVIQRPDGSKINILCNAGPIQDANDKTTGGIIAWRDITERKRSEETMQQALLKLNFHVENTPVAVIEWNQEMEVTRWSGAAEKIFEWQAEEVLGLPLTKLRLVFEEDLEEVTDTVERLKLGEEPYIFSYNRNYTKSGKVVHCEWYNSSLRDETGHTLSVLSLVLDITDRKQAEVEREQLLERERAARTDAEAANRVKDEFLAVLSHELRSPLNPILGWARLLQAKKLDEAKVAEALKTIERNARLQAELIEDLLDVSRILRGKLNLNITAVDLKPTIHAAIETVRLSAEAKSIQIQTQLETTTGQVSGDANRLQQIIWNLLSNAIKFTPPGGIVKVRLQEIEGRGNDKDRYAQITVTDTGKGINPDFLPYVFEYFRQADSTITRKFGGLGLGLAIVRHLVELHGGTIQADSPGEGLGATFTVKLPLRSVLLSDSPDDPPVAQLPHLNGIKVLVVDDDMDAREMVAFLLEQEMATVSTVASVSEALTALTQFQPNILLSDIGMPDVDGYTFIQKVRALPAEQGGQIPAIAVTAYAGEYDQQQALKVGFQKHISKPIDSENLIKVISELIHSPEKYSCRQVG